MHDRIPFTRRVDLFRAVAVADSDGYGDLHTGANMMVGVRAGYCHQMERTADGKTNRNAVAAAATLYLPRKASVQVEGPSDVRTRPWPD
jgi:hypothetical protein